MIIPRRCTWHNAAGWRCNRGTHEARPGDPPAKGRCSLHGPWVGCGASHSVCSHCVNNKAAQEKQQEKQERDREAARWASMSPTEQALEIKAKRDCITQAQQAKIDRQAAERAELIAAGRIARCPYCGWEVTASRVAPNSMIILSHLERPNSEEPLPCRGVGETVDPLEK